MNDKIYELEKQVEQIKNELETLRKKVKQENVGFDDDPIFLLSVDEYEKHKNKISNGSFCWWLRSPGEDSNQATNVYCSGNVNYDGRSVDCDNEPVRPAIKISAIRSLLYNGSTYCGAKNGKFFALGATWEIIDEDLAIAEMPIMFSRFDDESNFYATSEVRKKLLDWYKERVEW